MNDPQINVDHFYHRPTYHVVGLLTEHAEIPAISRELKSAGVDVAAVEILCGERGAAILDEHGRYHGLKGTGRAGLSAARLRRGDPGDLRRGAAAR